MVKSSLSTLVITTVLAAAVNADPTEYWPSFFVQKVSDDAGNTQRSLMEGLVNDNKERALLDEIENESRPKWKRAKGGSGSAGKASGGKASGGKPSNGKPSGGNASGGKPNGGTSSPPASSPNAWGPPKNNGASSNNGANSNNNNNGGGKSGILSGALGKIGSQVANNYFPTAVSTVVSQSIIQAFAQAQNAKSGSSDGSGDGSVTGKDSVFAYNNDDGWNGLDLHSDSAAAVELKGNEGNMLEQFSFNLPSDRSIRLDGYVDTQYHWKVYVAGGNGDQVGTCWSDGDAGQAIDNSDITRVVRCQVTV
ncbi:hypothetical protein DIURU_001887 [Diutina rugosa]|uniref:Uncharacterized protein n=1 Tax=Diutina rugosa TaxID=5481 RepID=A0A642USV4_DIURU|nr:uncharacterized protein DIURU_001887 [Diutina rugosa]KAA8904531.1 hypothetical protein DIURU_001887 [Diutina rugosa]